MREPTRYLARCHGFDLGVEDHGFLVLFGHFQYEDGPAQGLGYQVDRDFLKRFLAALGVERLQEVNGRSCWVTATHSAVLLIEPLHKDQGRAFDIAAWVAERQAEREMSDDLKAAAPDLRAALQACVDAWGQFDAETGEPDGKLTAQAVKALNRAEGVQDA
jgi:hypothetical protein